jgi:Big-like domain-containing protein
MLRLTFGRSMRLISVAPIFLLCFFGVYGCFPQGTATPSPQSATSIAPVAASTQQSTAINTAFPTTLMATVKDGNGTPVPGATVTFSAPNNGPSGTFAGGMNTVTTDGNGVATAPAFTANLTAGNYTVNATLAGVATPAAFTLTNLTGPPVSVAATGGTPQGATVKTAFSVNLQTIVKDMGGNPVPNVLVTFAVAGAGTASGTFPGGVNTSTTNTNGVATVPFLANSAAGSYTVNATVSGVAAPAPFALTNLAGLPFIITAAAGTPQQVTISSSFLSLQALVKDSSGNPVPNASVTFTAPGSGASGTFASGTSIAAATGADGVATASVAANLTAGSYTVNATVPGVAAPAPFSLTNLAGPPANIAATAGTPQNANINKVFLTNLQTTVTDAGGNLLAGVAVTFAAPGSGASGTFAGGVNTATTGANGVAAVPFTANATAGNYTVNATVPGVGAPAAFSLNNFPPLSIVSVATTPAPIGIYTGLPSRSNYPLRVNQFQSFTATILNDPSNQGVSWSISTSGGCTGPACGGVSNPTPTASCGGVPNQTCAAATYTAPPTIPNLAGPPNVPSPVTFMLTAKSIADPTQSASATIPVSQGVPTGLGWFEIPNTQIEPICPQNPSIQGLLGCEGAIAAWGGGLADTTRNRLLFMGGGHQNYWGNEVYSLDLKSSSPTYLTVNHINSPTLPAADLVSPQSCIEDWGLHPGSTPSISAPAPRETYGDLAYIAHLDKLWLFGGALATNGCRSAGGMWTLDLPTLTWARQDPTLGTQETTTTDIQYSDYDPVSKLVYTYIADNDTLAKYNPDTNTMTELLSHSSFGVTGVGNGVLDPVRHVFFIAGFSSQTGGMNAGKGALVWYDLNTTPFPTFHDLSPLSGMPDPTGCSVTTDSINSPAPVFTTSPGLAYDPVQDKIVAWTGGNSVFVIDTTQTTKATPSVTCTQVTFSAGPPSEQPHGTFGRFRYFPGGVGSGLNFFALVNDWQQNAFTLRLTPAP